MVKQWKSDTLGINYIYLSSKNGNAVLTSDGVLIPYKQFKSMTVSEYNTVKFTNGGYNYDLSRKLEKLVKSETVPETEEIKTIEDKESVEKNFIQIEKIPQVKLKEESKPVESKLVEVKEEPKKEEVVEVKLKEEPVETKEEVKPIENKKKVFNAFEFFYPKIMLCLAVLCSLLSIYFTATYLQRLQDTIIAYAISTSMLLFGVIGFQMGRQAQRQKRKSQCFIYYFTSILVIGFSMLSSVDVNYTKYRMNHKEVEEGYNINDGKTLSYNILKDELEDNRKQIDNLNEDNRFQQTQYVLMWDDNLKKNVIIEGRITSVAQDKITENKLRITELQERNKEINRLLIEYAEGGTDIIKQESKTDKAQTLTDLIGSMFGISGNVIQLLFLLVPSFFIDIINILSISIYCDKKDWENSII